MRADASKAASRPCCAGAAASSSTAATAVARGPGEIPPGPRATEVAAVGDDDVAPLQHGLDAALDASALIAAVVDVHVVGRGGDRPLRLRVENDQVGVAARGDGPLPRVQTEDLGGDGGGQRDEAVQADLPVDHSLEEPVSYTHLRAHETRHDLVCRLLLE